MVVVVLGCNNYEVIDLGVMTPAEKILQTAREKKVDLIVLSGLSTPSLDEMAHVAKEMEREGFSVPLLIGGATTSRAHTAVRIAPAYRHPVVHVLDASRAVGVVSSLSNKQQRPVFVRENCEEQEKIRQQFSGPRLAPLVSLQQARARRAPIDWTSYRPPAPSFTGSRVWNPVPLEKLVPLIDWTPFFHAWELKGIYPRILQDTVIGPRAQELLDDARNLLEEIVKEKLLTARAVVGFFHANSVGDDIELYAHETRTRALATFFTLRQQVVKPDGEPEYALADFIAPRESGLADYLGAFAVTAGIGAAELAG